MRMSDFIVREAITANLSATQKEGIIREMVENLRLALAASHAQWPRGGLAGWLIGPGSRCEPEPTCFLGLAGALDTLGRPLAD